jgi:hypothetical protein
MTIAALTWPAAVVDVAIIVAAGTVLSVLIWSIFRTGQTAIRKEIRQDELVESLRAEVRELRESVQPSGS